MDDSPLDLSRLALDRSPTVENSLKRRRRRWLSRYVIPGLIVIGFIVLLGVAAGRQLLPQPSVTVVPVVVKRGAIQEAGTALFQAAGWIEPRPTSVRVAALTPGVVEELLVVEGQQLAQGEPIAQLVTIDAELAVAQAKAEVEIRAAEMQRAKAQLKAAELRFEQPVHLESQLADAQSLLAKKETEIKQLPFLLKAAKAKAEFTRDSLEGKQAAENAIAGVVVSEALQDHAAAQAEFDDLQQRGPNLQREIEALQDKVNALQTQLELLVDERRQVEEAKAQVVSMTAMRDETKLRLRLAELSLERTVIRSPMQGRVLRLVALPGTRVMGLDSNSGHNSSTVVELYDPKRLQVRADVRLEHVPMVIPGGSVEVETASSDKPILGRVLQLTSSANIQKNTLEVKVELVDPPPTVAPEMLVTATFLAPKSESTRGDATETQRLYAPQQLVQTDENESAIWIVDADERAVRRTVRIGQAGADGLVEITDGLNVTDKLITTGIGSLEAGDAVTVEGDDLAIGLGR